MGVAGATKDPTAWTAQQLDLILCTHASQETGAMDLQANVHDGVGNVHL